MPALLGPALVAAAVLAVAGAQKLLAPQMTAGALRALGWPSSATAVRLGAAAELALAVGAVATGNRLVWDLIGLSYLAFAGFVWVALQRGAAIGSCGCFGRADTAPHPVHVVLDLLLAASAAGAAATFDRAPLDAMGDHPGGAALVVVFSLAAAAAVYAAFTKAPPRPTR
jgi:hypothetical protein